MEEKITNIKEPFPAFVLSSRGHHDYMEDRYCLYPDFSKKGWLFGGIYDGHYGAKVAESAARNLHAKFLSYQFLPVSFLLLIVLSFFPFPASLFNTYPVQVAFLGTCLKYLLFPEDLLKTLVLKCQIKCVIWKTRLI